MPERLGGGGAGGARITPKKIQTRSHDKEVSGTL